MRKIILYAAASIDRCIAAPGGDLEFLQGCPTEGYRELLDTSDTVIVGGRTYREMLCRGVIRPFEGKQTFVISRNDWGETGKVRFITENVTEAIGELRRSEGRNIFLVGGGETLSMLLSAGLVDEMRILYIPVILGKGTPLFPETGRSRWELMESKPHDSGMLEVHYRFRALEE